MLAAAIVAGFAGVMVTFRVWWHRAKDGTRRAWGKVRRRPVTAGPVDAKPMQTGVKSEPES